MRIFGLFISVLLASELNNYGAKCKWGSYLAIDIKFPCPTPYKDCQPTRELLKGCTKFKPETMKACCMVHETSTTTSLTSSSTALVNTAANVTSESESYDTSSDSDESQQHINTPAGMCGIYPPQEADQPPCLGPDISFSYEVDDTWSSADNTNGLFVVPAKGTFKSAECLCNAWGGVLATGPFEGSALKMIRHCTKNGVAWINVADEACLAIHSNTQKIQWAACESFLPTLCRFTS